MAGLHFDITADNTNLKQKLQEVERGIKETSSTIEREGGNIDILFQRMTRAAAAFGEHRRVHAAGQLLRVF